MLLFERRKNFSEQSRGAKITTHKTKSRNRAQNALELQELLKTLPNFYYCHFYVNLTLTALTIACITEFTGTRVVPFLTETHGVRVTFHTSIGTYQREGNSSLTTNSMAGFHMT